MQTLQLAAQCSSAGPCQAHQACSAAYMYQQLTQHVLHPSVSYRICIVVLLSGHAWLLLGGHAWLLLSRHAWLLLSRHAWLCRFADDHGKHAAPDCSSIA